MTHDATSEERPAGEEEMRELLREFDENPYDPARKTPEDVMRIFYQLGVSIVPVVSRRNALLGIITKDDITAEMSDIDRSNSTKIDDFITRIAKKRTVDEIIPFLSQAQEFTVINIFGEEQGRMSRVDLLAACDGAKKSASREEITASRDAQVMEWMIYLILEYIPRALYALNAEGKTIFYNNLFEELYHSALGAEEVDHELVERLLADPDRNDCSAREKGRREPVFFNTDLASLYEKVPMHSRGKLVGYLVYFGECVSASADACGESHASLDERVAFAERQCIVDELRRASNSIAGAASALGITPAVLRKKMDKHGIEAGGEKRSRKKARK